jgi:hypothetical protein
MRKTWFVSLQTVKAHIKDRYGLSAVVELGDPRNFGVFVFEFA